MKKYTLYLDESNAYNAKTKDNVLCVAGVIIPDNLTFKIKTEINQIKKDHLKNVDIPFHEQEIREVNNRRTKDPKVKEFMYYRSNGNCRELYKRLGNIFEENDLKVMGVCIDTEEIKTKYKTSQKIDGYRSAIELLMENFTQFLLVNNAKGKIILEARSSDSYSDTSSDVLVQTKYYFVMAMGTSMIPASDIQSHLTGIEFITKKENNYGLQLADFVPNGFARKRVGLKNHAINISDILEQQLYDGQLNDSKSFGMVSIPNH